MNPDINRSDRLIKKQIYSLNRHVPRKRKNLLELKKEERPHVLGSDGQRHRFKREELQLLSKIISPSDQEKLKLPIYLEIESMTSGARVTGRIECHIMNELLGKDTIGQEMFLYRPDIRIIRKKLPTTTQYIFLVR